MVKTNSSNKPHFKFYSSAISEDEKTFMKQNLMLSFDEPVNQVTIKYGISTCQSGFLISKETVLSAASVEE